MKTMQINKHKKLLCLVIITLLLAACQNAGSKKEPKNGVLPSYSGNEASRITSEDMNTFHFVLSTDYTADKINIDSVKQIGGILAREGDIIVSDQKEDCLVVIDHNGKTFNSVGKTGSADLEFLSPSRIFQYDENIYVIDQDNFRVQVLDQNLKFEQSVPIKPVDNLNPKFRKQHIAVNADGIFLSNSTQTMPGKNRGIEYYPSNDGEYSYLATEFSGPIVCGEEKLYAINRMISCPRSMDERDASVMSGPNWLFEYTKGDEAVRVKARLSSGLIISDMVLQNEQLIVFSSALNALLQFDTDGNYIATLVNFDSSEEGDEIFLSSDKKDSYWVAFQKTNNLYHIYKK